MQYPTRQIPLFSRLAPLALIALVFVSLSLASCGYKLASSNPTLVGDGTKTLKIKDIDNPTLEAWLPHAIRSSVRDAINARYMARWVDSGTADYELSIKIVAFTGREYIHDKHDRPLLYDNRLAIVATLFDGTTNSEVWRSGLIEYTDRADGSTTTRASSEEVIAQTMDRLADQLRNTF